jgi:hypothetical protein
VHGDRSDLAYRQVRSGQLSVVHPGLYRRLFRHRRYRIDQDRAPLGLGRPQWNDPKGANYTTVEASNGAVLDVLYDPKLNIRPWDKTLIRVMRGFLREGDTITVRSRLPPPPASLIEAEGGHLGNAELVPNRQASPMASAVHAECERYCSRSRHGDRLLQCGTGVLGEGDAGIQSDLARK